MARIVVIEDEGELRLMLCRALIEAGHELMEARNGREALPLLRRSRPDLVITDVIMPEQDGMELLMTLRLEGLPLRVIAMSGGGRVGAQNILEAATALGAIVTIAKPFTLEQMLAAVNTALAA